MNPENGKTPPEAGQGQGEGQDRKTADKVKTSLSPALANVKAEDYITHIRECLGGYALEDDSIMAHCPAHHDPNPSLHITHADNQILVHCHAGCGQEAVIQALRDRGLWPTSGNEKQHTGSDLPLGVSRNWYGASYVSHWTYRGTEGEILGHVVRYDGEDGKQVVPFFKVNGNKWKAGAAQIPRPLYGLQKLAKTQLETPVLIAEGEKAADAAQRLVGTAYVCMAWPGGTNAVSKGDWSPLESRDIVICRDADEPGLKAAKSVAEQCREAGARSVKIVEPPQGKSSGWDLADAEAEGWTGEQVREWIKSHTQEGESSQELDLSSALIEAEDFPQIPIQPKTTFLDPWLTSHQVVLISGWRNSGKTMFAMSLLDSITKKQGFGPWPCEKTARAVYLDGEMVADDVIDRLQGFGLEGRQEGLLIYSDYYANSLGLPRANLLNQEWRDAMQRLLVENNIQVWVVDNLASLTPGADENVKSEWDPVNQWFLELRFQGITSILVHHTGKGGGQRGTSAREDNIDMSLSLERPGNYHSEDGARFICKFNKARVKASELPYIKDYEFQLMQKEDRYKWTYRDDAADKKRQVLKKLDEKMPQKDIADELGVSKQYVSKVKSQATRDGILSKDGRLTQSGFQEIHKESG